MRPLHSPLRWWAVPLLLITAGVHVPLIPEHLREAPYVGVLFAVLTTACLVLAVLLVLSDSAVVWAATGLATLLAVAAFLLSRTVGLPQLADDIGNWTEPLGLPALLAETAALVVAAYALRHQIPLKRRNQT